jgi:sigma-E factor negative regulatory protein RseA
MAQQDASANDWHIYHLVGDVMRSNQLAPQRAELDFLARLELRLVQEVVEQPSMLQPPPLSTVSPPRMRASANGPWRWAMGVTFTLLVGVVSVGMWEAVEPVSSPQLALEAAPSAESASAQAPSVMLRDPGLDALMAAHQQLGGHSAWQMPSGFLRNATYERPAR